MNLCTRLFRNLYKQPLIRSYSKLPKQMVIFQDDSMVICWHPEQPFPYEYTKPLPIKEPEPESVLKIGDKEVKEMFRKPRPELIPEELARITYTRKHRWYPCARNKKAKKTPPARPYL